MIEYKITNTIVKRVDKYVFFLCKQYKKEIEKIQKILKINKIPKTLLQNFGGNLNEERLLYLDDKEVLFIGYGKNNECKDDNLYNIFGHLGKNSYNENNKSIMIELKGDIDDCKNQIMSFILGGYKFDNFKTDEKSKKKNTIYFYIPNKKFKSILEKTIQEGIIQNETRYLCNLPVNVLTSTEYEKDIRSKIKNTSIDMKVLNEKELKKQGLNLVLAVNKGSKNPAKLIILKYKKNVKKNDKPIVLIGKGVMFDTGGLNIKLNDFSNQKIDMTGSAIMFGILRLLERNNIPGYYIAILPIVQNDVDAKSTKPGDIVKSYSGKTVEIKDTDAEGRLILADAISYSKNYDPKMIIDIATLTGANEYTFGGKGSSVIGYNNSIIQKIKKIGETVHEHMWEMPMWEEYVELTKSDIADLRNHQTGTKADTIMAAAFLSNFVPINEKTGDWIHIDIAGADYLENDTGMRHMGSTAEGFRTIYKLLEDLQQE